MTVRRLLIAAVPVEGDEALLGLDSKPLVTEASMADAVRRVTRDLQDMGRRYFRDGWVIETDSRKNGATEGFGYTYADNLVVGKLYLCRE